MNTILYLVYWHKSTHLSQAFLCHLNVKAGELVAPKGSSRIKPNMFLFINKNLKQLLIMLCTQHSYIQKYSELYLNRSMLEVFGVVSN